MQARWGRRIVVPVTVTVAVVACGGVAAAKEVIRARDGNRFSPKRVRISEGEKVVWKNSDDIAHNVVPVGGGWSGFTLDPGDRRSRIFRKQGIYRYDCTLHAGMEGKIRVG